MPLRKREKVQEVLRSGRRLMLKEVLDYDIWPVKQSVYDMINKIVA